MSWWGRQLQIIARQSLSYSKAISWGSNHTLGVSTHLTKLLPFLTESSISAFRFHRHVQVLICHFNWILASLKCYQNDRYNHHVKSFNKSFIRNHREKDNVQVIFSCFYTGCEKHSTYVKKEFVQLCSTVTNGRVWGYRKHLKRRAQ